MNSKLFAAAGFGLALFGASAALAAPAADRGARQVAEASQLRPVSDVRPVSDLRPAEAEPDEEGANCSKLRKRLWIEGEGWLVRRVTICR
ncbi:hypothetical protein ASG52_14600 [Methylobacterium sp. Leaf456]|uniref:hypothetical protein n=1 Tax=Methylobacterium sp. Leaf456 TaxID=1736382 RepID=UPI0006FBB018|nr:hypothetical protein [Methylobacterium sp. Leaf456]KQT45394.1 hypothetical protein ASG52_14600 [Methylobacterium sp. Leaf456]